MEERANEGDKKSSIQMKSFLNSLIPLYIPSSRRPTLHSEFSQSSKNKLQFWELTLAPPNIFHFASFEPASHSPDLPFRGPISHRPSHR